MGGLGRVQVLHNAVKETQGLRRHLHIFSVSVIMELLVYGEIAICIHRLYLSVLGKYYKSQGLDFMLPNVLITIHND